MQAGTLPALRIAPSTLSADPARLGEEAERVVASGADAIHVDVMDMHYVPDLTFGPLAVRALRGTCSVPIDVHLMVKPVDALIGMFAEAGADIIFFRPEATEHVHRSSRLIPESGCKVGFVLNLVTPLSVLDHLMDRLDLILLMSVNPGFGGQAFIPETFSKARGVRARIEAHDAAGGTKAGLEIDGGVRIANIREIAEAVVETLVAGSAVFGTPDADGYYRGVISATRRELDASLVQRRAA